MTRIVIVGEMFYSDLSVGGGPMPGGPGSGGPVDPGYGRPGWSPVDPGYGRPDWAPGHPGNRPPGSYPGGHPGNRPPGSWGGPTDPGFGWGGGEHPGNRPPGSEHPGNRPPGSFPGYPTGQPLPPGVDLEAGTPVPPEDYAPTPPPEDLVSQYIVSVYDPKTMTWTTTAYAPPPG